MTVLTELEGSVALLVGVLVGAAAAGTAAGWKLAVWFSSPKPPDRRLSRPRSALVSANRGYYRVIVFIITPHPFSQAGVSVSHDEAIAWLSQGLNTLPRSIAEKPYSHEHSWSALIYEFEQSSQSKARTSGRSWKANSGARSTRKTSPAISCLHERARACRVGPAKEEQPR